MRGYLVVRQGEPWLLVKESNHLALSQFRSGDLWLRRYTGVFSDMKPGVYRAAVTAYLGLAHVKVGRKVEPATEAARLFKLASVPAWQDHGAGSPGVQGFQQRYDAAEAGAALRKALSKKLAEWLLTLSKEVV